MIRKFLKHVAGIDVAKNELVVSLGRMHEDMTAEIYAHHCRPNVWGMSSLKMMIDKGFR